MTGVLACFFLSHLRSKISDVAKERSRMMSLFSAASPMEMRICEPGPFLGLESNEAGQLHAWIRLRPPMGKLNATHFALVILFI